MRSSSKRGRSRRRRATGYFTRKLIILAVSALVMGLGFFFAKGKVIRVSDGDTVTVLTGEGLTKVRLYGIDCPESAQKGGDEATALAGDLMFLQHVSLSVMDKDQYGRNVAVVKLPDGRLANEELVRQGHAWVYRSYCNQPICARWLALERQAKKQGLGLWRHKNPVPPWQWRRANPRR